MAESEYYFLTNASAQFYWEARKLEVRLNDYLKEEELFVTSIRDCIGQFKSLHAVIEKMGGSPDVRQITEALALKTKCEKTFSKAIRQQGEAGHEQSHLLESYGALILALQKLEDKLTTVGSAEKKPAVST